MFGDDVDAPSSLDRLDAELDQLGLDQDQLPDSDLGDHLLHLRHRIDRLESLFASALLRFDHSRQFASAGSTSSTSWVRSHCLLSGPASAQRVTLARHLPQLPQTQAALADGQIGFQNASLITQAASRLGDQAVRAAEPFLLPAARQLDPGRFALVTGHLAHCADPDGSLHEAEQAHQRRWLGLSRTLDGRFHLQGLLDPEGGASLQTALDSLSLPLPQDTRSARQRRADALVELSRRQLDSGRLPAVGGQRPHLTLTASVETLAGLPGAEAGELAPGVLVPARAVARLGCDAAVSLVRVSGQGQPLEWTDAHHLVHWSEGGGTRLQNLVLVCRTHHRLVHEGGWRLAGDASGELVALPP